MKTNDGRIVRRGSISRPTVKKPPSELYRLYRPESLDQVIGQDQAVRQIGSLLNAGMPHVLMFHGPSGTGKTTLARIVASMLGCAPHDYYEVNCGSLDKPIGVIRELERVIGLGAMRGGKCRVWCLDEVQSLSRAKSAQEALLKILEEVPSHAYVFLCTTDPDRIIRTIRGRCTKIELNTLSMKSIGEIVHSVMEQSGIELSQDVIDRISHLADGSAREAIVLLQKVAGIEDEQDKLNVLTPAKAREDAFELVRLLVWEKEQPWPKVVRLLNSMEGESVESFRHLVLQMASREIMGDKCLKNEERRRRAYMVIEGFRRNFFESNRAGLICACYEILHI